MEKKTYPPFQSPLHHALTSDLYKRSCERKFQYQNAAAAEIDVRDLQSKGERDVAAYHCRFCGEWHIGHKLGSKYRKERNKQSE